MNRRSFLRGAVGTAGAVALAGCSARTEVIEQVERPSLSIDAGEYHHVEIDLREYERRQFNLRYEVTAEGRFDALLFGGQNDPGDFRTYVTSLDDAEEGNAPNPSERHSVLGAEGSASVNVPLGRGVHHLVIDNTAVGATPAGAGDGPNGTLDASLDLAVRDFQVLPW
jgi:hypothetical protein